MSRFVTKDGLATEVATLPSGSRVGVIGLLTGTADPSASSGVAATAPALYFRTGTYELWYKSGSGDTAWTQVDPKD